MRQFTADAGHRAGGKSYALRTLGSTHSGWSTDNPLCCTTPSPRALSHAGKRNEKVHPWAEWVKTNAYQRFPARDWIAFGSFSASQRGRRCDSRRSLRPSVSISGVSALLPETPGVLCVASSFRIRMPCACRRFAKLPRQCCCWLPGTPPPCDAILLMRSAWLLSHAWLQTLGQREGLLKVHQAH